MEQTPLSSSNSSYEHYRAKKTQHFFVVHLCVVSEATFPPLFCFFPFCFRSWCVCVCVCAVSLFHFSLILLFLSYFIPLASASSFPFTAAIYLHSFHCASIYMYRFLTFTKKIQEREQKAKFNTKKM